MSLFEEFAVLVHTKTEHCKSNKTV